MRNQILIFAFSVILTASVFIYGFYQFSPTGRLAFDRRILREGVRHWEFGKGMSNPAWSVAIIKPIEHLPLQFGWGLLAFLLFAALILWVPDYKHWTKYVLLVFLPVCYPALRNYAEGNYEAYVLWGLFCSWYGYQKQIPILMAFGVLLATIKLQACIVLVAALPWYIRGWEVRKQRNFYLTIAIWTLPILILWGKEWVDSLGYFSQRGYSLTALNLSPLLLNALRVIVVVAALWVSPTLTRMSMSLLIITSMLIAPYLGGLTSIVILAIGVTALFAERKWLPAVILLVLYQEIYIFGIDFLDFEEYLLIPFSLTYIVLWWENYQRKTEPDILSALVLRRA